jgi:tetratricopeptide (TPR) repeat protein
MELVRAAIIVVAVGLVLGSARIAAADADDRARVLFDQATAKLDRGDLDGALADYRAAYELAPRAKILLNIGAILLELGRTVEAANTFADYLERADADRGRVPAVRDTLATLDRDLGLISIDVGLANREVLLDDTPVGSSPLRRTVRAAPGRHDVVLQRSDGVRATYPIEVTAAGRHQLVVANPTTEPSPLEPGASSRKAPASVRVEGRSRSVWRRPVVWSGLATGVALTAGIVFGLQARALEQDLDAINADSGNHTFVDAMDLEQRARDRALMANIGFVAAAACGAVTAVLLVRDLSSSGRTSVRTALVPGGAALAVEVRY